jgi:hypothetical protein
MDENNKIWRLAQARLAEQQAALNPETATRRKPGPTGEHKWAEKTVKGIVVGRNKIIVPPEEVIHLASLGCSDREIADYFDVHENTLRYNFKEFLTKGRHQLRTTLRQAQLRVALEGNPTMLIWLGKNILQQNENGQANEDNRPLPWTDEMDDDVVETDDVEDEETEDADD